MEPVVPDIAWDLRTPDVDLVRGRISGLLRPFRLSVDPRRDYDARLFGRRFARTGLVIIEYGQEVDVDAEPMRSFSLIQIPIRGSFELRGNGRSAVVHANEAHLLGPINPLHMHWSPDCRLLILRLDEWATRRLVARCRPLAPEICSEHGLGTVLPLDQGPGLSLFRILCLLRDDALSGGSLSHERGLIHSLEGLLMRLVTRALENGDRAVTCSGEAAANAGIVARAQAFMIANRGRRISAAEVASACVVSRRTLFLAFRMAGHAGPKAWLTEWRLDRAREALRGRRQDGSTVTEIALHWGFGHLGRFSAQYRERFGENPSDTIRRDALH